MDLITPLVIIFLYIIPLYVSNSTPVLSKGRIPLDLNKKIGVNPILGKGKTIEGTLTGILCGIIAGLLITIFFPYSNVLVPNYLAVAILLSFGAIIGDLVKSFFKRRFGIKSGQRWVIADQLDFILGGLILSSFLVLPEIWLVVILLIATFFIHLWSNFFAHKLGLKKVPW